MRKSPIVLALVSWLALTVPGLAGSKESKRGNYWDAVLRDGLPLYEDEDVQACVDRIGWRIVGASGNPLSLSFRFLILNSDEPTAFASPGGTVYVTTALLQTLSSEDELGAVIAHEVGHINQKHGMKTGMSPRARKFWSILLSAGSQAAGAYLGGVVSDALPADASNVSRYGLSTLASAATSIGTSIAGQMILQSFYKGYGEEFEFKADELALDYTARANYRSEALIDVLERIEGADPANSAGISHLHSSLRMLKSRISHAKSRLAE